MKVEFVFSVDTHDLALYVSWDLTKSQSKHPDCPKCKASECMGPKIVRTLSIPYPEWRACGQVLGACVR